MQTDENHAWIGLTRRIRTGYNSRRGGFPYSMNTTRYGHVNGDRKTSIALLVIAISFAPLQGGAAEQAAKTLLPAGPSASAPATARTKLTAWELGVDLGLIAAFRSLGDEDQVMRCLDLARAESRELGLGELTVPGKTGEKGEQAARIVAYIFGDEERIASRLRQKYSDAHAKTYSAGARTMLVLTLYAPEGADTNESIARGIEKAARGSEIPIELWKPLLELIRKSASYADVKTEVMKLQKKVYTFLKEN